MPNYTPNYNLKKPLQTENYNIEDANGNMDIVDVNLKNVEDVVFKYQDPVVVGNLIKLSNKGNSSRLYFKLGADVIGDSILISTDDGVTSKPLREVDGTTVTSLEAGFAEVVADATFFTLRNRGISAKDKKALIDIVNSGLLNESSLKDEVIKALNLVNTEGVKISTGGLWSDVLSGIPNIKTGKKWAKGQSTLVNTTLLNVSGLTFKPSMIIITPLRNPLQFGYGFAFYYNELTSGSYILDTVGADILVVANKFTITNSGFSIDGRSSQISSNYVWWAFE